MAMSLIETLDKAVARPVDTRCRTCQTLRQFPKEEREYFNNMLTTGRLTCVGAVKVFAQHGVRIGDSSVRRHLHNCLRHDVM